jgi:hypothetical protein
MLTLAVVAVLYADSVCVPTCSLLYYYVVYNRLLVEVLKLGRPTVTTCKVCSIKSTYTVNRALLWTCGSL